MNTPSSSDGGAGSRPATPDAIARLLSTALAAAAPDEAVAGTRIGPYKLLQKIGEGGFGLVWMAEQLEPLRRRVALKIIKAGLDTAEVIARFEAERQALARMDHPNIARVFDAGATGGGRPYFVMELVRGVAITRYCDDNRLSTEARLRLFISVCQAVQHAHLKGVIHRDLKPSNILITLHDGVPVPKVIDFGIAKAIDQPLTEKTLVTQFHAFVGTPVYTSPEQMEMSGLDVDTRSDVYSLGVLLYELLVGRAPFDADALLRSGLDAMRRTIREIDPPQPSQRLRTLPQADRTTLAGRRSSEPADLTLQLRGDLDSIVMHCLEKDRTRRYETALGLAGDVERYLRNEPIVARPAGTWYRIRKFVRRHRTGVAAASAIAASLVGGLIFSSVALLRERAAHRRAEAAERTEARLRADAETARHTEAVRSGRASLALGERFLADGDAAVALAHFVRAARSDPENTIVGPRLVATLAYHNFLEPTGAVLPVPGGLRAARYLDAGRAFTVGWDGTAQTWDLARGEPVGSFACGSSAVNAAFSPDGRRVAIGREDGTIDVRELPSGRPALGALIHARGHASRVGQLAYTPNGRWLITADDEQTVVIWDARTGERRATLHDDNGAGYAPLAVTADSTLLCTVPSPRGAWRTWRIPSGEPVATMSFQFIRGYGAAFSPDGRRLAVSDNAGAQLYDPLTGRRLGGHLSHDGHGTSALEFSHDGRWLATSAYDGAVKLWDVATGEQRLKLEQGAPVWFVAFTPDDRRVVTLTTDKLARVWDAQTGQLAAEPLRCGTSATIALSPDGGELLVAGPGGTDARRWRLTSTAARPFALPPLPLKWIWIVPERGTTRAMVVYHDHLQTIDWLTGERVGPPRRLPSELERQPATGFPVTLSHSGRYVRIYGGGEQQLWDLRTDPITMHPLGPGMVMTTRFSEDERFVAVLDDNANTLRVWSTADGALRVGPVETAGGRLFTFSGNGERIALVSHDRAALVYDTATGQPVAPPLTAATGWSAVALSPDGRRLVTGTAFGSVFVTDVATHAVVAGPLTHAQGLRGVEYTRDGRRLLTWTPGAVRVWDAATFAPLTPPLVGGNDVVVGALSDDGTRLVTLARTGLELRVWGAVSGQLVLGPVAGAMPTGGGLWFEQSDRFAVSMARGVAVYAMPPQSAHRPAPEWLLRLATAVAGGEIDERAAFRDQPVEASVYDALRRELAALPGDAPYVEWGRWLLADHATRPLAPGFKLTPADLERLTAELNEPEAPHEHN